MASFGSYTFAFGLHEAAGFGIMASEYATATYHAQDIKVPNISWKNTIANKVDSGHQFSKTPDNSKKVKMKRRVEEEKTSNPTQMRKGHTQSSTESHNLVTLVDMKLFNIKQIIMILKLGKV